MIVFISDLHLTDGTFDYDAGLRHDTSDDAFRLFWDDIYSIIHDNDRDRAVDIKDVKIILLGDILELRTTTRWMEAGISLWQEEPDHLSDEALEVLRRILESIIYERAFQTPRRLKKRFLYLSDRHIDENGVEGKFADLIRERRNKGYRVSFIFVAGNHDRIILDGSAQSLRDIIKKELGWEIISAGPEFPFEARFAEPALKVMATHGHRGDPLDFFEDFKKHPLGDLLPDVLGRMMSYAQGLATGSKREIVKLIMNIDLVRPFEHTFDWLLGKIRALEAGSADRAIADTLRDLRLIITKTFGALMSHADVLLDFIYSRVRTKAENAHKFLIVLLSAYVMKDLRLLKNLFRKKENAFKNILKSYVNKVIRRLEDDRQSLSCILDEMAKLINRLFPDEESKPDHEGYQDTNAMNLLKESDGLYVILGHTHDFEVTPMGIKNNAFYINSGTWKKTVMKSKVIREEGQNKVPPKGSAFQKWAKMTYIIFFEPGEMKDHVFDLWHGNLQFEEDKNL
jgi:UDP-2,3-diacylglucosamine pyrophosphatase LpxH